MSTDSPAITYSSKPWIKQYDKGVPASLAPYPEHPLHDFLRQASQKNPDAPASVMSAHLPIVGRQASAINYRELDVLSDALGVAMQEMGVKKGDRVAIIMANCTQFAVAFYATLKIGAIVCAANPTYPAAKMMDQLKDCGANTVICLSLVYNLVKEVQAQTDVKNIIVTNIKDYLPPLAKLLFTIAKEKKGGHFIQRHPADHDFLELVTRYRGKKPSVDVQTSDMALFQYTGGTTGIPKAAVSTHGALVANALQIRSFLGSTWSPGSEVFIAAIPLFHVFGMVAVMSTAVSMAAKMLMVPNPRDIDDVLDVIDKLKPSIFMGVPAIYNAINNHPDVAAGKYSMRSVRACVSGSAPLAPATKRRFEELSGGKLVEGFGMSECPTAVAANPLYGEIREGSIGVPLPDVEMRIVSLDDGVTEMPVGQKGELVVFAPNLMLGYHGMPAETDNALRTGPDGRKWLYTGDIAYMDESGYFYLVDRKKDMFITGGFKVYPSNVEKVFLEHPAVSEVGVAAIPHPDPVKVGQEALKAWVVLKPDQKTTEDELIKFVEKKLVRYEVPTRIEFIPEMPKTLVGKVLRRELVKMELDRRQAGK